MSFEPIGGECELCQEDRPEVMPHEMAPNVWIDVCVECERALELREGK